MQQSLLPLAVSLSATWPAQTAADKTFITPKTLGKRCFVNFLSCCNLLSWSSGSGQGMRRNMHTCIVMCDGFFLSQKKRHRISRIKQAELTVPWTVTKGQSFTSETYFFPKKKKKRKDVSNLSDIFHYTKFHLNLTGSAAVENWFNAPHARQNETIKRILHGSQIIPGNERFSKPGTTPQVSVPSPQWFWNSCRLPQI